MKHNPVTKILSGLTALVLVGMVSPLSAVHSEVTENGTITISDSNRSALIGVENPEDYFLGAASQFSVFLHGDFDANGSDCEGRLAAGGNANLGTSDNYSVGARLAEDFAGAHIVIGGDTLQNFQPNAKNFVIGSYGTLGDGIRHYLDIGSCKVYEGELFSFDEAFALLNERSAYLKDSYENATLEISPYFESGWQVYGSDSNLNVLTLDSEAFEIFDGGYLQLQVYIPEGSYLVINVPGETVDMPLTNVTVYDEEGNITHEAGENMPILYNLYEAESFHYTGSIQGSTLAPNADATGDEGGHVAGATIAKSFTGGIEFGYSSFNPSLSAMNEENIATTETTTETTTTAAATTTTESATTTTTETTTTTTAETTTTTEATTTTTETTTTTTTTETTTTEATTTTTTKTTADAITDAMETTMAPETTEETTTDSTTTEATTTTTEATTALQTTAAETTASTTASTGSPNTGDSRAIYAVAAAFAAATMGMALTGKQRKKN